MKETAQIMHLLWNYFTDKTAFLPHSLPVPVFPSYTAVPIAVFCHLSLHGSISCHGLSQLVRFDEWESSKNVAKSPLLPLHILTSHRLRLIYYYCTFWKAPLRNYILVKNQTISQVSIRTFPSVCGIGGSTHNDTEALKHIKASVSHFLQPPAFRSFCKSDGKKAGKNTFSGAQGLHRNILPFLWSFTTKEQALFKHGKAINML